MTVGELMEALEQLPRDAEALVECPFDGGHDGAIGVISLVTHRPHGRGYVILEAQEEGSLALWEEAYPEHARSRVFFEAVPSDAAVLSPQRVLGKRTGTG